MPFGCFGRILGGGKAKVAADGSPAGDMDMQNDEAELSGRAVQQIRLLNLKAAILHTYEFTGTKFLVCRILFWATVLSSFFALYSRGQIINASNVVTQLTQLEGQGLDGQSHVRTFKEQTNFLESADYMVDWATALFNNEFSGVLAPANTTTVTAGDYSRVNYVRMMLDLETSCRYYPRLGCYYSDGGATLPAARRRPRDHGASQLPSGLWRVAAYNAPFFLYGGKVMLSVLLYSQTVQDSPAEGLRRLAELRQDLPAITQYGYKLVLEVVADYTIKPRLNTWASLNVQRSSALSTDHKLDNAITTYVSTLDLSGSAPTSNLCIFLMTLTATLTLVYLFITGRCIWLYYRQRMHVLHMWQPSSQDKGADRDGLRHRNAWFRLWCYITYFMYNPWNLFEAVALGMSALWCAIYYYGTYATRNGTYFGETGQLGAVFSSERNMNRLLQWGCLASFFFQIGSFVILLNGLSLYPFFRIHRGLRIYLNVVKAVTKAILDFLVFFAFMFLLIGFFCLATTQLPGVQPDLQYPDTAFAALAKLTFGFYEYNDFVNNAVPKTAVLNRVQDAVFWISIIFLYILVQNILLAIVSAAYNDAIKKESPADASFIFVLLIRLTWYPIRMFYGAQGNARQMVQALDNWRAHSTFTIYYRRWAVAKTAEAQLLSAYYTFFLNWEDQTRSPWLHDPLRVVLAAANHSKMEAERLPPHSITEPLTYEQLVCALLAIEAEPSFQTLKAFHLPGLLKYLGYYAWDPWGFDDRVIHLPLWLVKVLKRCGFHKWDTWEATAKTWQWLCATNKEGEPGKVWTVRSVQNNRVLELVDESGVAVPAKQAFLKDLQDHGDSVEPGLDASSIDLDMQEPPPPQPQLSKAAKQSRRDPVCSRFAVGLSAVRGVPPAAASAGDTPLSTARSGSSSPAQATKPAPTPPSRLQRRPLVGFNPADGSLVLGDEVAEGCKLCFVVKVKDAVSIADLLWGVFSYPACYADKASADIAKLAAQQAKRAAAYAPDALAMSAACAAAGGGAAGARGTGLVKMPPEPPAAAGTGPIGPYPAHPVYYPPAVAAGAELPFAPPHPVKVAQLSMASLAAGGAAGADTYAVWGQTPSAADGEFPWTRLAADSRHNEQRNAFKVAATAAHGAAKLTMGVAPQWPNAGAAAHPQLPQAPQPPARGVKP